jgi:hypothetical protein
VTLLAESVFEERALTLLRAVRRLRLAKLYGAGLARHGLTAREVAGPYEISRAWALAIFRHPDSVDGLVYRARHDDTEYSIALFDRARHALRPEKTVPYLDDPLRLERLLTRYDIGLLRDVT